MHGDTGEGNWVVPIMGFIVPILGFLAAVVVLIGAVEWAYGDVAKFQATDQPRGQRHAEIGSGDEQWTAIFIYAIFRKATSMGLIGV